jgi:hypothetical protein
MVQFTLRTGFGAMPDSMSADQKSLTQGMIAYVVFEGAAMAKCLAIGEKVEHVIPDSIVLRGVAAAFMEYLPTLRSVFESVVLNIPSTSTDDLDVKADILRMANLYSAGSSRLDVLQAAMAHVGIPVVGDDTGETPMHDGENTDDGDDDGDDTDNGEDKEEAELEDEGLDGEAGMDLEGTGTDTDTDDEDDETDALASIIDEIKRREAEFYAFVPSSEFETYLHQLISQHIVTALAKESAADFATPQ